MISIEMNAEDIRRYKSSRALLSGQFAILSNYKRLFHYHNWFLDAFSLIPLAATQASHKTLFLLCSWITYDTSACAWWHIKLLHLAIDFPLQQ